MENEFLTQVRTDTVAYLKTLGIVGKLRLVGGISRVLGLFLLILTTTLLVFGLTAFLSVAAIIALSFCMPVWAASLIMGGLYVIFIIIAISFRKQLFINPFVAILTAQLFAEEGRKIEEERLRKEAEND